MSTELKAWMARVRHGGAAETLFELEVWLAGIRSFLDLRHVPLSESERAEIATRSFLPEIRILRRALVHCEQLASALTCPEISGGFDIGDFIKAQAYRDAGPAGGLFRLLEFLNDLGIVLDGLGGSRGTGCQGFLAIGRIYQAGIANCRYVEPLLGRRYRFRGLRPENRQVAGVLAKVDDSTLRRSLAQALLRLLRLLKCLRFVESDLTHDLPLQPTLVIFSLLHEEMGDLSEFLRSRLLGRKETGKAASLVAYSLRMESQRVLSRELLLVSRELEPSPVYTRVENSHGLLRNCCQSCILTLLKAIDPDFDASTLFPTRAERLVSAEKLRLGLWELRGWLTGMLESGDPDPNRIVQRLNDFKEASLPSLMYRDWAEFESFLDAICVLGDPAEIRTRIRKFSGFLEMLIQEVSKRSVFQERAG